MSKTSYAKRTTPWFFANGPDKDSKEDDTYAIRFRLCEEPDCSRKPNHHLHCLLCKAASAGHAHCKRHFEEVHARQSVIYQHYKCLKCKLNHGHSGYFRPHYHCLICNRTIIREKQLHVHMENHTVNKTGGVRMNTKPKIELNDVCEYTPDDPPLGNNDSIEMNHKTNVACDNGSIEMNIKSNTEFNDACDYAPEKKSRRVLEKMITCPVCRKEMCSRSLPRHYRNIHNKEIENVVYCVDKIRGLYMV
ncbi:uncharacterized protein LOC144424288 [Styela clava]